MITLNNSLAWCALSWLSYHINIRNPFLKWTFAITELLTTSLFFSNRFKSHDAATLALVFLYIDLMLLIFVCVCVCVCVCVAYLCASFHILLGIFCTLCTQTEQTHFCSAFCCVTLIFHFPANDYAASSVPHR